MIHRNFAEFVIKPDVGPSEMNEDILIFRMAMSQPDTEIEYGMLAEAIPRLAVCLRTTFPDASVELVGPQGSQSLRVTFRNYPAWEANVVTRPFLDPAGGEFQILHSELTLRYDCLQTIPEEDFLRVIACENFGLRGVSVLADSEDGYRLIRVRAAFLGAKGRSRDEAENLSIDLLSLVRYARLLDDRIKRSSAGGWFSYEMYHSQYFSATRGRSRYINYARSIFQGSTERVFGQIASMLKDDYHYNVEITEPGVARVSPPSQSIELVLRMPVEVPMLTCYAPMHVGSSALNAINQQAKQKRIRLIPLMELVAKLNHATDTGHFEVSPDGSLLSFVAWKHLTNDLRFYSLDQMVASVHAAQKLLERELDLLAEGTSANLHAPEKPERRRPARRSA